MENDTDIYKVQLSALSFLHHTELTETRVTRLGTAYVALVAYTAIQVGVYGYLGGSVAAFVESVGGPALPWWLYGGLALLVVAYLGYRNIDLSAKVLGVALVLEIGIVLVMDSSIFLSGGAEGVSAVSFTPAAIFSGPIGVAILFALTGFMGFESTAVFRDEARTPEKTIPRATYIAVAVIGAFYAISSWALVEGWGPSRVVQEATANPGSFMLDTAQTYIGTVGHDIMNILLLTSLFACVLSFHNVIARYQFTLANEKHLPARLATVHAKHESPPTSSLVQSLTAALLVGVFSVFSIDPLVIVFGSMAGVATVGMMMLLIVTSIAVVKFFAAHPELSTSIWKGRQR